MIKIIFILLLSACAQEPQPVFNVNVEDKQPRCLDVPVVNYVCGRNPMCAFNVCHIVYQDGSETTVCTINPSIPKRACQ